MRAAREWKTELSTGEAGACVVREEGRHGQPTLRVGRVYLHSRYEPEREAAQLVDSAGLAPDRPVLVVGMGLGYHVLELVRRGFEVLLLEPDPAVARHAVVGGPLAESGAPLWVGPLEDLPDDAGFQAFAARMPQLLVHPPTARLHPEFADEAGRTVSRCALGKVRLSVAVVGPMYGGSLPITGYLANAFRSLGHRTLQVDNHTGWPLYEATEGSVKNKTIQGQLGGMLTNFLGEWSFARVAEFAPEVCIVLAQAPAGPNFAARLAERGIVTAFWFVENWRHMPYWKQTALEYDYFFHIQPGEFEQQLDAIGCKNHAFVQTGCDPAVHRPVTLTDEEHEQYTCDMSFAGAGYPNRNALFRGLTDFDFKIWGVNWTARELLRHLQRREERFTPDEFMKVVAGSKINLNLHSSTQTDGVDPRCDAINPRVFEIAAAGGFQLCDPCIGLERHFDLESEIPTYTDLKSLRERIHHYLAHEDERLEIARRARERALRDHTYTARAQQMLDSILERHGARLLKRGVKVQRTIGEMAAAAGPDSELGRYLAQLPPELLFTHDVLKELLPLGIAGTSYPARLFTYLLEVRDFAEKLLQEKR